VIKRPKKQYTPKQDVQLADLERLRVVTRPVTDRGEAWQRDRPGLKPILAYGVRMDDRLSRGWTESPAATNTAM
jgi:hypothetical protein